MTSFKNSNLQKKVMQDKKDVEARRIKTQQYFVIAALGIIVLAVIVIAVIQFRITNKNKKQIFRTKTKSRKHFTRIKINTSPTHPIRKNGFAWRTYCRHCT